MINLNDRQLDHCKTKIETGIKSFVETSGATGAVVAVSGGVDSALVLSLASKVVDTKALFLPEAGVNLGSDLADAKDIAESLGVPYSIIEIEGIVESVMKAFPWVSFSEDNKDASVANIKPRIRMLLTYLASNLGDRVVLGTSNKTELLVGYLTKHGDGAADFEPIAQLYKTWVWQLAEYVGVLPQIVRKTPSAGLWVGQTDEGEIGVDYPTIESILYGLVEKEMQVSAVADEFDISLDLVEKISGMMRSSRHKREMPASIDLDL